MKGVTTDNRAIELSQSTVDALKARLWGPLLLAGDAGYADSRETLPPIAGLRVPR